MDSNKEFLQTLSNVRLLFLPTANVNGFSILEREEQVGLNTHDPNRDFPYNTNEKCFKTSTAIVVDKIFRDNLIVGTLTFHGGDNSISYPWGNYAHQKDNLTGDQFAFEYVV